MFGNRIKIWVENYIVRPRKKEIQKEKSKGTDHRGGVILESSESLTYSDTGISSSSQQILSSSNTDNRESYSTTTMESERGEAVHCHTATSLPSPESAYSTGYSTDGTSPGTTGPPEYYINIRTGKHYFPSPAPTPTSPQPNTTLSEFHSTNLCRKTSALAEDDHLPSSLASLSQIVSSSKAKPNFQTSTRFSKSFLPHQDSFISEIQGSPPKRSIFSASVPSHSEILSFSKSPCKKLTAKSQLVSLKLFLKSPKQDKRKSKFDINATPTFESKKKSISNAKPKKWFKQPFQKFGHRRIDSSYERIAQDEAKIEMRFEKNFNYFLGQENSTSPRQRNRIKTNPWLPTEPVSSQNFHNFQINFSSGLTRNRSCSSTPLQNRKTSQVEPLQNLIKHLSLRQEETKSYANSLEKAMNRYLNEVPTAESSGHSDEDLTLNEMMGTYNESYIYEKETDILSDSEPTDCEDYVTDSEAENGGDEQDSHDDELDFIDNGCVTEREDNFLRNTGKCTHFDDPSRKNYFFHKDDHHVFRNISERRKNSKKFQDPKTKREKRKQTRNSFKRDDEEKQKTSEKKARLRIKTDENVRSLNLNKVFVEGMKSVSKSAERTSITETRLEGGKEFRETHKRDQQTRRNERKPLLNLGDTEADKKYKELIKEAQNIFETLKNSPIINKKLEMNCLDDKDLIIYKSDKSIENSNILQKAEIKFPQNESKKPELLPRKSPKELGLKLTVEIPKKLQRLNFQICKESSFKGRTSAHSPLDPLGPTLRNFAVFKPAASEKKNFSMSSSEDSESGNASETKVSRSPIIPKVPVAFQSFDLGKPLTSYCPQSEPVKRKIYSCSKTYDKLVKQFEIKTTIFEESTDEDVRRISFAESAQNLKA